MSTLPTFQFSGYVGHANGAAGAVYQAKVGVYVDSPDEARAIAATFPKSWRVKAGKGWGLSGHYGYVIMTVDLGADGVNGGANEAGLKRLRAMAKRVPFEFHAENCLNAASPEQLAALLEEAAL